jgi:hypothetical protein
MIYDCECNEFIHNGRDIAFLHDVETGVNGVEVTYILKSGIVPKDFFRLLSQMEDINNDKEDS